MFARPHRHVQPGRQREHQKNDQVGKLPVFRRLCIGIWLPSAGWLSGFSPPQTKRWVYRGIREKRAEASSPACRGGGLGGCFGGLGSARDSPSWVSSWHKGLSRQNYNPAPACDRPGWMPSFGGRMMGPGLLSQLNLFELNLIGNERRQQTKCCWIFIKVKIRSKLGV